MSHQSFIVAVGGIMASGKTTLARGLAEHFGWKYLPEAAPAIRYLPDLFKESHRWAFETQLAFFSHKAIELSRVVRTTENVILDRPLEEDWHIFAHYFHSLGYIDDRAYSTYTEIAQHFIDTLPHPDLTVVCRCSLQTAAQRIQTRGRTYQQTYPQNHLKDIAALYEKWLLKIRPLVFTISSDKWDWRSPRILNDIANELYEILSWQPTTEMQLELFSEAPLHERKPPQLSFFEPVTEFWESDSHAIRLTGGVTKSNATVTTYPSIYLAAPFTGQSEIKRSNHPQTDLFGLETADGYLSAGRYREMLLKARTFLRKKLGLNAVLPHWDINRWGRKRLSSLEVVQQCTTKVQECDCFAGILGESHGSHYEFGIAYALGKPCVLVRCEEITDSFIANGLQGLDGALLIVRCRTIENIPGILVSRQVKEFLGQFVPVT